MKRLMLGAVLGLLVAGNAQAKSPQDAWWTQLQALCGKALKNRGQSALSCTWPVFFMSR